MFHVEHCFPLSEKRNNVPRETLFPSTGSRPDQNPLDPAGRARDLNKARPHSIAHMQGGLKLA